MPEVGHFVTQGEMAFGFVSHDGDLVLVLSPISGQVRAVNGDLENRLSGDDSQELPWALRNI